MTDYIIKSINTDILKYQSFYSGKSKKAKRIDIEITTNCIYLQLINHNKQSGIYQNPI